MAGESPTSSLLQPIRSYSSSKTINLTVHLDPSSGQKIVLWTDIQLIFPNAKYVLDGEDLVSFVKGNDFKDLVPLRIYHRPGVILEVVTQDAGSPTTPPPNNPDTRLQMGSSSNFVEDAESLGKPPSYIEIDLQADNTQYLDENSVNFELENDTELSLVNLAISDNTILNNNTNNNTSRSANITPNARQSFHAYHQLYESLSMAITNGQMMQANGIREAMNEHFENLQLEMEKNRALQERMLQMQQQMTHMQNQTLEHLILVQTRVETLLTQTFELHEYPIPRLFIVLPKPSRLRDKFSGLFSNQFQLFFLCECGEHTMSEGSSKPHAIHLAKHEGYELSQPTEFFEKYGEYILTLMQMLRYGITAAGFVVPALDKLNIVDGIDSIQSIVASSKDNITTLVNQTILYLEERQKSFANENISTNQNTFDKLEVLEGADLRRLESYLNIKDSDRALGNLYRTVTSKGHVKWVCADHYKENYQEAAMDHLRDIISTHGGILDERIGMIEISLNSSIAAKHFYNAIAQARGIQELAIKLDWDATLDDLRKLSDAVLKSNIVHLTVDGGSFDRPNLDFVNRGRRYDPITQAMSNGRLQCLRLRNFRDLTLRTSSSGISFSPQLRVLDLGSSVDLNDKSSKTFLLKTFENCRSLSELRIEAPEPQAAISSLSQTLNLQLVNLDVSNGQAELISTWKRPASMSRITPTSGSKRKDPVGTARYTTLGNTQNSPLKIRIVPLFKYAQDYREKSLSLYSQYGWAIEELDPTWTLNDDLAKVLDDATLGKGSNITTLTVHTNTMTQDGLGCVERLVDRSPLLQNLCVYFDTLDVQTEQEKLKYLQGQLGKRATMISLKGRVSEVWMARLSSEFPDRSSFPRLKSLQVHIWSEALSSNSSDWIVRLTAGTLIQPSEHYSSSPGFYNEIATDTVQYGPLKELVVKSALIQPNNVAEIVAALDLSRIEDLSFRGTVLPLECLKSLVNTIIDRIEFGAIFPMRSIDLQKTQLEHVGDAKRLIEVLAEKAPHLKIHFNPW